MTPEVSILIVNYKTPELVIDCVKSLERYVRDISYEIIIVDNESSNSSRELMARSCPQVTIIANPENSGFGKGNNIGFQSAKGDFVFLINSDTVLQEDSLNPLVTFLKKHPESAIVGPAVFLTDGSRQPQICGNSPTIRHLLNDALFLSKLLPTITFFQGLHLDHITQEVTRVGWISGVCMLIRRQAYEKVKGFNPDFFLYSEDIDLCLRINRDCGAVYHLNKYGIVHHHGASSKSEETRLRNCIMQQENFLQLLPTVFSADQIRKAKSIIKIGLFIRLGMAYILRVLGHSKGRFLVHSCQARLGAIQGNRQ